MEAISLIGDGLLGNQLHGESGMVRINPELLEHLPPPPNDDVDEPVHMVVGSEEWHAEVPPVCFFLLVSNVRGSSI